MTYSSTLDGAITADSTDVFVDDAPTAPYPPFVQVGSELMAVVSVQLMAQYPVLPGSRIRLAVQRGALGTTRATHSDAAAIYAVTPVVQTSAPSAPPASDLADGSGVPQTVRLMGPLTIRFDDADIVANGKDSVGVIDLTVGMTVLDMWIELVEKWQGADVYLSAYAADEDQIIRSHAGSERGMYLGSAFRANVEEGTFLSQNRGTYLDADQFPLQSYSAKALGDTVFKFSRVLPARVLQDCSVTFYLDGQDEFVTAGELRVFAMVAQPA